MEIIFRDDAKFALASESRQEGGRKNFPSLGVKLTPKITSHDWTGDSELKLVISRANGDFEEYTFKPQGIVLAPTSPPGMGNPYDHAVELQQWLDTNDESIMQVVLSEMEGTINYAEELDYVDRLTEEYRKKLQPHLDYIERMEVIQIRGRLKLGDIDELKREIAIAQLRKQNQGKEEQEVEELHQKIVESFDKSEKILKDLEEKETELLEKTGNLVEKVLKIID